MGACVVRRVLAALLALSLAGCAPAPPPSQHAVAPANFPASIYRQAAARGEPAYRIDGADSLLLIYAYRGGTLAAFGHDHVISTRDVHGYALIPKALTAARADLYFPVAALQVDEPHWLKRAGFAQSAAVDSAGTRHHMLRDVLQARRYPYVQIHAVPLSGAPPRLTLRVALTLHGVTRTLQIPVGFTRNGRGFLVQGEFNVRQTDFGMTPYSTLGGALVVKDRLHITFRLRGERVSPAPFGSDAP